jgi:membrane fusion protein, heavy metal efflux system
MASLKYISGGLFLLVTGVVLGLWVMPAALRIFDASQAEARAPIAKHKEAAEYFRDRYGNDGLRLTENAIKALGVNPVEAKVARDARPLPPQVGTVNLDLDRLFAVRPRFAGQLVEVQQVPDSDGPAGSKRTRPLRYGDKVKPSDKLGVIWSKELGEKKAALVDALCSLRLSEDALQRQEKTFYDAALSLASLQLTKRQVQTDSNAVLSARRTLKMWKLSDAEIKSVEDEAKTIHDRKRVRNPEEEMKWAATEVAAPTFDNDPKRKWIKELVVVEKNTNIGEMVDPSRDTPLFRLADLSKLQIWVNPPEEYLPLLRERLEKKSAEPLTWDIQMQADGPSTPPLKLRISQIARSLEPNQHTPMVIGYLDNKDGKYLVGQFVTATIYVPPDKDTIEIPTEAVNEVEGQALVFVQPSAHIPEYVLKRVAVVRRFKDATFVRSRLSPEDERVSAAEVKAGRRKLQPLSAGDRVVTRGVIEMTAALTNAAAGPH